MPTRNEIQDEIFRRKQRAQDEVRHKYLRQLFKLTGRDTVLYAAASPSLKPPNINPAAYSIITEDMNGFMAALHGLKGQELDLILHSPGGSLEAADQIVLYLRNKYKHIRAIIPQNAMSAATMIACACDTIVMGKHSAIGPIDTQVTFPTETGGTFTAPAQAILDEFEQAKKEIKKDPTTVPLWALKIKAYPHGLLQICETTLKLAKKKVEGWLNQYMFYNDEDKKGCAISEWLGNAKEHKTHGRPINIDLARKQGLKVEALEDNQHLQEAVLSVFHATMATFEATNCVKIIENYNGKGLYINFKA